MPQIAMDALIVLKIMIQTQLRRKYLLEVNSNMVE